MATSEARARVAAAPAAWRPATRIAFRFCFLYFGLYIVLTQMLTSLLLTTTNDSGAFEVDATRPVEAAITWLAAHVFHIGHPLVTAMTGSGDRAYDWVEVACILALALAGTLAWSLLDRRRREYTRLFRWFHLVARFALGATLLTYGAFKIIPVQMPYPSLTRLLEPYGSFSPMGVLWASIGAAPLYEFFAGSAEFLAGTLLLFPRTAALGALLGLADAVQVLMLNLSYDVPVKLLAFHLIPLALFVLAPDARRLRTVLLSNRPAAPAPARTLFASRRANHWALAAQVAFALYLIGGNLFASMAMRHTYGPDRPRSPLYGIWTVDTFVQDGQTLPPLLSDPIRWRRLVFDQPNRMVAYTMDDSTHAYAARIDPSAHTLALNRPTDKASQANFHFGRPAPAEMLLDGTMDGHRVQMVLSLYDRSRFTLVNRGFHWVQDSPYNR